MNRLERYGENLFACHNTLFQAEEDVPFAGENFVRHTGESQEFAKSQVFAWDAMDKGVDVHAQANPTQLEYLRKSYRKKKVRTV